MTIPDRNAAVSMTCQVCALTNFDSNTRLCDVSASVSDFVSCQVEVGYNVWLVILLVHHVRDGGIDHPQCVVSLLHIYLTTDC